MQNKNCKICNVYPCMLVAFSSMHLFPSWIQWVSPTSHFSLDWSQYKRPSLPIKNKNCYPLSDCTATKLQLYKEVKVKYGKTTHHVDIAFIKTLKFPSGSSQQMAKLNIFTGETRLKVNYVCPKPLLEVPLKGAFNFSTGLQNTKR